MLKAQITKPNLPGQQLLRGRPRVMKKQEFLPAAFLKIWNLSFKSKHTPLLPLADQHFCFGKNAPWTPTNIEAANAILASH